MKLKVKKLFDDAIVPNKPKTQTDSGFDCYAHNIKKVFVHNGTNNERELTGDAIKDRLITEMNLPTNIIKLELNVNERALIGTGIAATMGDGYEIQVRPRSGNALKRGLIVTNSPGTIDSEYRAEIGVIITNTSRQTQYITLGEPIAQLVPMKIELPEVEIVSELDDTIRGQDGFGSTNK